MITRISIAGYKSLRQVELTDLSWLIVLFGPNAAGKSNFLDALDLLGHLAAEESLAVAFQRHRGSRNGKPMPVQWFFYGFHGQRSAQDLRFEVDLDLQGHAQVTRPRLRYRLDLSYLNETRKLIVQHESLMALRNDGLPDESIDPFIDCLPGRVSVRSERQEMVKAYEGTRTRTLLSEISDSGNYPHLVAVARALRSLRIYYVEPEHMRSTLGDLEATYPGPRGEELASFYHWLQREHGLMFRNLVHNLSRLVPGITGIEVRETADGFLDLWIREEDGTVTPAALVSEGTLRLLSILALAATPEPPGLVGFEEPENGINPSRLDELLTIMNYAANSDHGMQLVLTTHSPAVVNFFTEAARFFCKREDSGSTFVRKEDQPPSGEVRRPPGFVARTPNLVGDRFARGDFG